MINLNVCSFSDRVNDFLLKDTLPVELLNKKHLTEEIIKFYALYGAYEVAYQLQKAGIIKEALMKYPALCIYGPASYDL